MKKLEKIRFENFFYSGKSTLLKSLSGRRNATTRVEGSIYINGREVARKFFYLLLVIIQLDL